MRDIFLGFSNTLSSYQNNLIQYVVLLLWNAKARLSACTRQFGIEIQAVVMNQAQLGFLCPRWVLQQAPPGPGTRYYTKTAIFHWGKFAGNLYFWPLIVLPVFISKHRKKKASSEWTTEDGMLQIRVDDLFDCSVLFQFECRWILGARKSLSNVPCKTAVWFLPSVCIYTSQWCCWETCSCAWQKINSLWSLEMLCLS